MLWKEAVVEALGGVLELAWDPCSGRVLGAVAVVAATVASIGAIGVF